MATHITNTRMGSLKRICCLVEKWESGGIESFLYNILTHINMARLEVDIVAEELCSSIFTPKLEERGVSFFELSGDLRRVKDNWACFRSLAKDRHYDVLHLNAYQGLSLTYLHIAKQEKIQVRIAHSHNTALRKSLTKPLKLMVHTISKRRYTKSATNLWACSRVAATFLFSINILASMGYRFIPNGIDTERFRYDPMVRNKIREELGLDSSFVVGHVGRLCQQKNQAFLLEVFSEVLKLFDDSRLILVGEGEDRSFLEQKAHQLGITGKVIFYGASDHVEHLLWAMDVFVFPSRFEGLGIAAVEAQATGLPVLCSEGIPSEAMITNLAVPLPLSAGAEAWAEAALIRRAPEDRTAAADGVFAAGFDVAAVAKDIRDMWMR